jgi:hypothetical protein
MMQELMMKRSTALIQFMTIGLLAFAPMGCDSESSGTCVEGESLGCVCESGNSGAQLCLADGSLDVCVCSGDTDTTVTDTTETSVTDTADTSVTDTTDTTPEDTTPVDTTPPTMRVVSVSPANDAEAVGIDTPIVITFSAVIDANTVNGSVTLANGAAAVSGTASVSGDTVTFTPSGGLSEFRSGYTLSVGTGVRGTGGDLLDSETVSSFSTVMFKPRSLSE